MIQPRRGADILLAAGQSDLPGKPGRLASDLLTIVIVAAIVPMTAAARGWVFVACSKITARGGVRRGG